MKKILISTLLCTSSLFADSTSSKIDEVFDYFRFLGNERRVDESLHSKLFSPDFKMIINGKVVLDGLENLTPHFELLLSQVSRVDLELYEKIVAEDKAIMRYDLTKPGKSTSKVIAIFKFKDGLVYEMNEVVYSTDPSNEIDFTSK
jgi:hypothetical protein